MKLLSRTAEIFIPDGAVEAAALARTTHMAISAHQDDIEIMAAEPILRCLQDPKEWFAGMVVTDGHGSPRTGSYEKYTDAEMQSVRIQEQKKAAYVGEYGALVLLNYPSKTVKDKSTKETVDDIAAVLQAAKPKFLYTHNLADKHDTHVSTALRVIAAVRKLEKPDRPQKLFGCEVWRDLDWMIDSDKIAFDLTARENLQASLLGVYDSQITGGKRYDLASMGRRRANATYYETHGVDAATGISYAMDLTPLIVDDAKDIPGFILEHIRRFEKDVEDRLTRLV